MLRNVPIFNEMFYRCFTKENDGVKHLAIYGFETRKI